METKTRKLSAEQMFMACILESVEKKITISPEAVAKVSQSAQISMCLDETGNFVLTVKE